MYIKGIVKLEGVPKEILSKNVFQIYGLNDNQAIISENQAIISEEDDIFNHLASKAYDLDQ